MALRLRVRVLDALGAWYEGGRATRSVGYLRRREALKAVGLDE
jgi:hypothetical protein